MPMHDWLRVDARIYHDFHNRWITHLTEALNAGLLPDTHYALGEAGDFTSSACHLNKPGEDGKLDNTRYLRKIVVRQAAEAANDEAWCGDQIVALAEIVSGAHKVSHERVRRFVGNVLAAIHSGINVLLIDPFPPIRRDPQGIQEVLCKELDLPVFQRPVESPLTLVSYCAGPPITAYVEPTRVGDPLKDMPLFLSKTQLVPMPLEATYLRAWTGEPRR